MSTNLNTNNQEMFTEKCKECGSALSLVINKKLHDEQTPFQRIEIFETKTYGNLMTIDGFVMLTQKDNFIYHEMISHPALFSHPSPKKVVIVGGGDCGTLLEVSKHAVVEEIIQVEIDERVTRLAEKFFPELCRANDDPRARFVFEDAIAWMKNAPPDSLDIIIIDSTDPIGPAAGLFSTAFYRDCKRALRHNGIVVQQSESPLFHAQNIINAVRKNMRGAELQSWRTLHFPQSTYPTGWWSATLGCKDAELDFHRENEAKNKSFATYYYNHGVHTGSLALPEFLRTQLI